MLEDRDINWGPDVQDLNLRGTLAELCSSVLQKINIKRPELEYLAEEIFLSEVLRVWPDFSLL